MGRPRNPDRMTRMLTLRVPDEQYDWLIERAIAVDGDLSAATRDAIAAARIFYGVMGSIDPHAALQALIDARNEEEGREVYFDLHGHYPGDEPDVDED